MKKTFVTLLTNITFYGIWIKINKVSNVIQICCDIPLYYASFIYFLSFTFIIALSIFWNILIMYVPTAIIKILVIVSTKYIKQQGTYTIDVRYILRKCIILYCSWLYNFEIKYILCWRHVKITDIACCIQRR